MKIRVELFAGMERFKPAWADGAAFSLEIPDNSTLLDIFRLLNIPEAYPLCAMVNGVRAPHERPLQPNEKVSFLSIPAGG